MNTSKLLSVFICCGLLWVACGKEANKSETPETPPAPAEQKVKKGDPIEVNADGKVRFYLSLDSDAVLSSAGVSITSWSRYHVSVDGVDYAIQTDEEGFSYIEADAAAAYNAVLFCEESARFYGLSRYVGVVLPFSQFQHSQKEDVAAMPLYASYAQESGNVLEFKPLVGALALTVKGSGTVSSVHVEAPGAVLGGIGTYQASKKSVSYTRSVNFSNLNCTARGSGVPLSGNGTAFLVLLAPGEYPEGLDVRVSSMDHKTQTLHLDVHSLAAGQVTAATLDWAPASDLLFSEAFDNFVWGGDYVGGASTSAFSPDGKEVTPAYGVSLTGYEEANAAAEYNMAGSGYIQADPFSQASGKTVQNYHNMGASYVRSRNIGDWALLFRCQEYQGYLGVGTGDKYSGIVQTPPLDVQELVDLEVSFDVCPKVGCTDEVTLVSFNGGLISSAAVDGTPATLSATSGYIGTGGTGSITKASLPVPGSTSARKDWHHVVFTVQNANDATVLRITSASEESGSHGYFLDNLQIRRTRFCRTPVGAFRILYWNIQDGMWADQEANYSNFTAWVKKYNPDVCIWCEGRSLFKTNSSERLASKDRFLEKGWPTLASRYGHSYVESHVVDNYPEVITSKYAVTKVDELPSTVVGHGAGLFRISLGGKDVYFLATHLWPQKYARGAADQTASAAANGGDYTREEEMKAIVDQLLSKHTEAEYLYMMGDFNSRTSRDNWHYGLPASDTGFLAQDYLINHSDLIDVIAEKWPGHWLSSVNKDFNRMDMFYATPKAYAGVQNAFIIVDGWTLLEQDSSISGDYFCRPSDHRPVLVDIKLQ